MKIPAIPIVRSLKHILCLLGINKETYDIEYFLLGMLFTIDVDFASYTRWIHIEYSYADL